MDRGWDNIVENDGFGLALTGMLIVFVALVLITCLIAVLPRIVSRLESWLPPPEAIGEGDSPDEMLAVAIAAAAATARRSETRPASEP